jgi:hypothetical protein
MIERIVSHEAVLFTDDIAVEAEIMVLADTDISQCSGYNGDEDFSEDIELYLDNSHVRQVFGVRSITETDISLTRFRELMADLKRSNDLTKWADDIELGETEIDDSDYPVQIRANMYSDIVGIIKWRMP